MFLNLKILAIITVIICFGEFEPIEWLRDDGKPSPWDPTIEAYIRALTYLFVSRGGQNLFVRLSGLIHWLFIVKWYITWPLMCFGAWVIVQKEKGRWDQSRFLRWWRKWWKDFKAEYRREQERNRWRQYF